MGMLISETLGFVLAFILMLPRMLIAFLFIPLFSFSQIPKVLRTAIVIGIVLPISTLISSQLDVASVQRVYFVYLIVKEAAIGLIIGLVMATPFWVFQSMGALIDNQRGALAAGYLNPASGPDASMLGDLLSKALVIYFIEFGVFALIISISLDTFSVWLPTELLPEFSSDGGSIMASIFNSIAVKFMLYAGPVVLILLLIEAAFAIMGAYSPQMQVYFMAMPAKSLVALMILYVYLNFIDVLVAREVEFVEESMTLLKSVVGQ